MAKVKTTKPKKPPALDGYLNDLDRAYARHLDQRKANGEIWDYRYQAIRLVISPAVPATPEAKAVLAATYTPDFLVVELPDCPQGCWSIHETKGFLDVAGDAWLKFKLAAALYPFPAYMIQAAKSHTKDKVYYVDDWQIDRYGR